MLEQGETFAFRRSVGKKENQTMGELKSFHTDKRNLLATREKKGQSPTSLEARPLIAAWQDHGKLRLYTKSPNCLT